MHWCLLCCWFYFPLWHYWISNKIFPIPSTIYDKYMCTECVWSYDTIASFRSVWSDLLHAFNNFNNVVDTDYQLNSIGVERKSLVRHQWVNKKHKEYREQIQKNLLKGTVRKNVKLLQQNRIVTGLLSRYYKFRVYLNKIGLYELDLSCRQCYKRTDAAHLVLCECEVLDHRRKVIYGHMYVIYDKLQYRLVQEKECFNGGHKKWEETLKNPWTSQTEPRMEKLYTEIKH